MDKRVKKAPLGISQYTTWPLTFDEDLRLYRRLGFRYIEVCEAKLDSANPHPQLRNLIESGLEVSSIQPRFHSPFPNSLRPRPHSVEKRVGWLRDSIRLFGRYFPGTTLVLNTGLAPQGNFALAHEVAVREFKAIAPFAADHGVRVALEPLHPVYMNTDTFICSLAQAGRMIEAVDHPAFGLFLDVWHYWEEPDGPAEIRRQRKKIFGVHLSDWRRPRAFGDRLLPGAGELPLADMVRTIRRAGYQGVYTLEIFSDLKLKDSLWSRPQRTAREGKRALARLWRQAVLR